MKFTAFAFALATTASLTRAQPHRHFHHRHDAKRSPEYAKTVDVPGPVVTLYELNGKQLAQSEVCKGIEDGSLKWAEGTMDPPQCDSPNAAPPPPVATSTPVSSSASVVVLSSTSAPVVSSATPVSSAAPASSTKAAIGNQFVQETSSSSAAEGSSAIPSSTQAASGSSSSPTAASSGGSSSGASSYDVQISSGKGLDTDFPDGEIDCSTFPEAYGAIPIEWEGVGNWSGIQYVTIENGAVQNIVTASSNQNTPFCAQHEDPTYGSMTAMCSYACPAGYQKSQWPQTQGSDAQSVGGLMCGTDGKLHLTNSGLSNKLCIQGTGLVNVQNNLRKNAPICRTDYPGVEGETVPLDTQPNNDYPLTCPDAASYYKHMGAETTAEYYVNLQGTPVSSACTWSYDGSHEGNWAPIVFGVGTDISGSTWLSIMTTQQNNPSSYQPLDYTVELQGDFGGAACFLVQDASGTPWYCTAGTPDQYDTSNCQTYDSVKKNVPGCTVQLRSGKATYVLS